MKLRLISKQQIAEEKEREKERTRIAAERMKYMGRLLQGVRDARDYLKEGAGLEVSVPEKRGILSYSDLMTELNSLLDRYEQE